MPVIYKQHTAANSLYTILTLSTQYAVLSPDILSQIQGLVTWHSLASEPLRATRSVRNRAIAYVCYAKTCGVAYRDRNREL